jgi:hypothetical protein
MMVLQLVHVSAPYVAAWHGGVQRAEQAHKTHGEAGLSVDMHVQRASAPPLATRGYQRWARTGGSGQLKLVVPEPSRQQ